MKEVGKIIIGDNCFFNDNCNITALNCIEIGNKVSFGHNCIIVDHDHDYKNDYKNFVTEKIVIGDNVWIGANVTILKGVHIGNNCIIAAGTLVNKDIQESKLVYQKKEMCYKEISIKK